MAGFNRVILIGNLTRDPDYRQLSSGQGVCRLGLATNRQFKSKQTGNVIQEVCYVDIDVWGAQAESCRQYLQKGRSVLVEGRLKLDSWEDPNGQKRSKHSIVADRVVFLGSSSAETEQTMSVQTTQSQPQVQQVHPQVNQQQVQQAQAQPKSGLQLDPNNAVERDLLEQLQKAQGKVKAATTDKKSKKEAEPQKDVPATGEIDFKDQPPFEDKLPF